MSAYEVTLNDVEKTFESFRFGPFSLNIEPGVVAAFVGPNGSGKTTLFQMLMNVVRPDRGTIELFGEMYGQNEVGIKRKIGYVADSSYVEEANHTVEEAARFHSHWFPSWSAEKWAELCVRFELNPQAKVRVLSKGMKRRLAFSLAIAQMPELLILDEPSSGLDPFIWRVMLDEIREYMGSGNRTVLIATHSIEEVRRLADYVALVYNGSLLGYWEKDTMADGWRSLWVEMLPAEPSKLPGVVEWEQGSLARLVTREAEATEAALRAAGIAVVRRQAVELDEMLHHLIAAHKRTAMKAGTGKGVLHS